MSEFDRWWQNNKDHMNNAEDAAQCAWDEARLVEASETPHPISSTEFAGSVGNKATPRFDRGRNDKLYLATTSRDEFGEDQETHHYMSEECGKRLISELAAFMKN